MDELIISGTSIRQDAAGRYCLNDLHRASGGLNRHRPSLWAENQQTKDLVSEIQGGAGIPALVSQARGIGQGTYACKELVYSYAMWISPAFNLKVIRAYDALVQPSVLTIPQSLPEALRLAADLAEQKARVEEALAVAAPKAQALDRIASADGSFCIRDAAKNLQLRERDLYQSLVSEKWIYRRPMGSGWLAYSDKLQRGLLEHKVTTGDRSDGSEWVNTQVRITAKGVSALAQMLH